MYAILFFTISFWFVCIIDTCHKKTYVDNFTQVCFFIA